MVSTTKAEMAGGLASRALLDKIDKLRELGISSQVPLPQMVVVGDQSAGKSSVLESLTGFHFPRSVTLCTRHATEIICRREQTSSTTISIVPHETNPVKVEKARSFKKTVDDLDGNEFAKIFQDAAEVMGINVSADGGAKGSAFSKDVLRVEISGPEEEHLTVIDVPGMFENDTPGLTTKDDIELVKSMVKSYISESRTIILAVVPCNGDIANQKILTFAAEADPEGKRTLGVLTKPDLAVENATKNVIVDLVLGKRKDISLGYCVVKNRGADDTSSSMDARNQQEQTFFEQSPWNSLPADRLGIPALRIRIQQLLVDRTRSEFPKVRADVSSMLKQKQKLLNDLGESRSTTEEQRSYMGTIASHFTSLKHCGLDATYSRDPTFSEDERLRLITRVREMNEKYRDVLYKKGHTMHFSDDGPVPVKKRNSSAHWDIDPDDRDALYDGQLSFKLKNYAQEGLEDIIAEAYVCDLPQTGNILDHLEKVHKSSRGYELGTMLPATFKHQSAKWQPVTLAHVSNVIVVVHDFVLSVLKIACPDADIRDRLNNFVLETIQGRYRQAVDQAKFLLHVEFENKAMTFNPEFDKALAAKRTARLTKMREELENKEFDDVGSEDQAKAALECFANRLMSGSDGAMSDMRLEIHDVLQCYYEIARSRFVDVVCQQVVDHFLLFGADSPLTVICNQLVLRMTPEELEDIAGEDPASRGRREKVAREVDGLTKALRVLRI